MGLTVQFMTVRIYARSGPHVHGHKRLDDDATDNVKPHLQLHVICGVVAFAASRECQVYRLKGSKGAIVCYYQGRIFNPTNLLNHVAPFIESMMQMRAI